MMPGTVRRQGRPDAIIRTEGAQWTVNNTRNYKNIRKGSINGFFIGMAICAGVFLVLTLSLTLSVQASSLRSLTTQVSTAHTSATATLTVSVTNASDVVNGDTSNIQSLLANPGPDGISFRADVYGR